jgi:hypothetical protein
LLQSVHGVIVPLVGGASPDTFDHVRAGAGAGAARASAEKEIARRMETKVGERIVRTDFSRGEG